MVTCGCVGVPFDHVASSREGTVSHEWISLECVSLHTHLHVQASGAAQQGGERRVFSQKGEERKACSRGIGEVTPPIETSHLTLL